jgi:hypothetical protein
METALAPAQTRPATRSRLLRWAATFLAFPPAGLLVVETVGGMTTPAAALAGGALAGAVIGAGQWLALRPLVSAKWIAATATGLAAGTALGVVLNGGGTAIGDLLVLGAVQGLGVGIAQRVVRKGLVWPELLALAWPLGWLATWAIGVDVERAYVVPGSSGAIVLTAITAIAIARYRAAADA